MQVHPCLYKLLHHTGTPMPLQTTTPCRYTYASTIPYRYTYASTNYYTIQVHLCLYKLPHHVGTPMPLQTTTPCRYTYAFTKLPHHAGTSTPLQNYNTMDMHNEVNEIYFTIQNVWLDLHDRGRVLYAYHKTLPSHRLRNNFKIILYVTVDFTCTIMAISLTILYDE